MTGPELYTDAAREQVSAAAEHHVAHAERDRAATRREDAVAFLVTVVGWLLFAAGVVAGGWLGVVLLGFLTNGGVA